MGMKQYHIMGLVFIVLMVLKVEFHLCLSAIGIPSFVIYIIYGQEIVWMFSALIVVVFSLWVEIGILRKNTLSPLTSLLLCLGISYNALIFSWNYQLVVVSNEIMGSSPLRGYFARDTDIDMEGNNYIERKNSSSFLLTGTHRYCPASLAKQDQINTFYSSLATTVVDSE